MNAPFLRSTWYTVVSTTCSVWKQSSPMLLTTRACSHSEFPGRPCEVPCDPGKKSMWSANLQRVCVPDSPQHGGRQPWHIGCGVLIERHAHTHTQWVSVQFFFRHKCVRMCFSTKNQEKVSVSFLSRVKMRQKRTHVALSSDPTTHNAPNTHIHLR